MEASITVLMGLPRLSGKRPGSPIITVMEASITVLMGLSGLSGKRP